MEQPDAEHSVLDLAQRRQGRRGCGGNIFYKTKDGKRRWVIYKSESEASQISPEWHGWLHHTWNEAPTELAVPRKAWEQPHQANLTGTPGAYVPAGSLYRAAPAVRSDYDAWRPE